MPLEDLDSTNEPKFYQSCLAVASDFEKSEEPIKFVESISLGAGTYAYLISKHNLILIHPNSDIVGKDINQITDQLFYETLCKLSDSNNHILYEYTYNSEDRLIYFYKSNNNDILAITGLEKLSK